MIDESVRMWKETAGDYIRMLSGVLMCPFLNLLNLLKAQRKSTALDDSTGSVGPSGCQVIPHLLRNPKVNDIVHKGPPLVCVPGQMNPLHNFPS